MDGTSFCGVHTLPQKKINLNSACTVPFLYSPDFFRIMPFTTPAHFFVPYASIPNSPVGTALYDWVYNDNLASIKVPLMNMLNLNRLPNMPMGFPYRVVYDGSRSLYMSRESYKFQERFCLSDRRGHNLSPFPLMLLLKSKNNCHGESLFLRGDLHFMKGYHVRRGLGH